jgi:hypothetical protein
MQTYYSLLTNLDVESKSNLLFYLSIRMVGNMRDPGVFVLALKEIFDILYQSPERENTSLKMSMFYNKGV